MERAFLEGLNAGLTPDVVEAILGESEREAREAEGRRAAERFDAALSREIAGAHGRSERAITAMLDLDALRGADDPEQEVRTALAELRKSDGYLFDEPVAPFAVGAGSVPMAARVDPMMEAVRRAAGLEE